MTTGRLVRRALQFYWRSHLAVVAGVATAVAVLAGALLVGDSVRGSLRDLALERLGRTDRIVTSTGFFREALAAEIAADPHFAASYAAAAPLMVMTGVVTAQPGGRRVSGVAVYGVDDRFWAFHGVRGIAGPSGREAFLSRALADELGAAGGATVLVRIARPTAIPIDSLHGRKEDPGRTLRLTAGGVLAPAQMGDFSIQPQQGSVRALFVPLVRLQQDLDRAGRVNAMLVSDRPAAQTGTLESLLRAHAGLEDAGLKLRVLEKQGAVALESEAGLVDHRRAAAVDRAAAAAGVQARPVLTYLANTLRSGAREVPYSLVSAVDLERIAPAAPGVAGALPDVDLLRRPAADLAEPAIVINDWTARDLAAGIGDPLELDYYVWQEPGYLETRRARFRVGAVVPIAGAASDRDLAPVYPGITAAVSLGDWDPPFPIDLKRVRPADEAYWKQYRTTPKAFIAYAVGQRLWASPRYGDRTSVRVYPPPGLTLAETAARVQAALRDGLEPAAAGFSAAAVRSQALAAARGSTDFGEYFVYFSFFLVASALVLAALFFRLGVEQRAREVGLLRAVGCPPRRVRRLFTAEGLVLAIAGSLSGTAGAIGYAGAMLLGLRTWWSGAVGTRALALHVSPLSLAAGAAGAMAAAVVCIWAALRGLGRLSERDLLAGRVVPGSADGNVPRVALQAASAVLFALAAALVAAASMRAIDQAEAFFLAGTALLGAGLCAIAIVLRRPPRRVSGRGRPALLRIGMRNTTERPGRSVLAIAVIAAAAFIVISVGAFRRPAASPSDRRSGTGGFPLLVNLELPLVHDPNSREGREALGVGDRAGVTFVPFRLLPGDDASCLNLYQPVSPRVLGAGHAFVESGRFAFQESMAAAAAERANPWRLLEQRQSDGTIPVIGDANSITYVLHKAVGEVVPLTRGDRTLRLKIVGALADSILQGELVMSEANFTSLFPEQPGYRFLLVDSAPADTGAVGAAIEAAASDFGADAVSTPQRLAEFHTVENTYLSTFQTLGGLGLLVGTIGLAAVLLRNVLERRRELALLRAVGYGTVDLFTIVAAENAALLAAGLGLGAAAAALAIAPAAMARGGGVPIPLSAAGLLLAMFAAGLLSSWLATRAAVRAPLVASLRAE